MKDRNLIPFSKDEKGNIIVSGRDLHDFLEIETPFRKWIPRMIKYGFEENVDYTRTDKKVRANRYGATTDVEDIAMTLDMAKEISMLQRNEKGKQARQYFIQVEKAYKNKFVDSYMIDDPVKRAERWIEEAKERKELAEQNEIMKPKAVFADAVAVSKTSILIGELAKLLKQNGIDIGAKRLFTWLRDKGYLIKRKGNDWNTPTQRSMELGLFKVKETTINHASGNVTISKTTKVTGRGQIYFINKFKKMIVLSD